MSDAAPNRRALNAVRMYSDTTPTTIITACRDDGVAAAISIEIEQIDGRAERRMAASFFWDEAARFAEALLIIVKDAKERDQERAAAALDALAEEDCDE